MTAMSLVTHVLRETAEDYRDPLNTDPTGQIIVSWDGFVIYQAALISRAGFFPED